MLYAALLDANVLHPMVLCDLLIRLAQAGLYRACWTDEIIDEVIRSIHRRRPDISDARLERRTEMMKQALPSASVDGYQPLVPALSSFGGDAHVVAAAVVGRADAIVTSNTRDFPANELERLGLEVLSPDEFLLAQWGLARRSVLAALRTQAAALTRPRQDVQDLLRSLRPIAPKFVRIVADDIGVPVPE